jgi:hypothetical protein
MVCPLFTSRRRARSWRLLMFCYPNLLTSVPVLETMDDVLPMLEVAMKYGIEKLENRLREALFKPPLAEERPMQLFVMPSSINGRRR